jgi:transcription elongation factor SPT5
VGETSTRRLQGRPRFGQVRSRIWPEVRGSIRPPQKFFNSQEVAAMGKQTMRQRFPGLDIFCDVFEGNYYHDGYQLKEMTVGTMVKKVTTETPPTLDELQSFRKASKSVGEDDDEENEGSKLAGSLLEDRRRRPFDR